MLCFEIANLPFRCSYFTACQIEANPLDSRSKEKVMHCLNPLLPLSAAVTFSHTFAISHRELMFPCRNWDFLMRGWLTVHFFGNLPINNSLTEYLLYPLIHYDPGNFFLPGSLLPSATVVVVNYPTAIPRL